MIIRNIVNCLVILVKRKTIIICLSLAAIVLWVDYITGWFIQFPIVYILPVGIAAWHLKKSAAYTLAILLPSTRIAFHFLWNEIQILSVVFTNTLIFMATLLIYVYLIILIAHQRKELEKEVNILEGILPICASCKKIQNKDGSWEQIEGFIQRHSEADFSHSICPDCMKKLYPEYVKDMDSDS
ncbi:MAG: hypothetical protein JXN64_10290 [Spirochaetes bacterium]|nr:hypothetical protein [Spirochaetota bacterium]